MSVAAEAGREVPMARFPMSEMPAKLLAVPIVKAVPGKVMPVREAVAGMRKAMSVESVKAGVMRYVAESTVETAAAKTTMETAAETTAARHGLGLPKDDSDQTGGSEDDRFLQQHRCLA